MNEFDPESLTQERLHDLRHAAEAAWGEDTRHESHRGHPLLAAGQCYVTSRWLQSLYGGHVGRNGGHFFWVSPGDSHVVDLAGDNHAYGPADPAHEGIPQDEEDEPWVDKDHHKQHRPGPVLYKHANHPLFKGYQLVPNKDNPRVEAFKRRADSILNGERTADFGWGGDAYPAQEPEAIDRYHHDFPERDTSPEEYSFVYAGGKLEVGPTADYDKLAQRAGVDDSTIGPSAVGRVRIVNGKAEWSATANVAVGPLVKVLRDYSFRNGWDWGQLTDLQGNKLSRRISFTYYDGLLLSEEGKDFGASEWGHIEVLGKTAKVHCSYNPDQLWMVMDGIQEWAEDHDYHLSANDNVIKTPEDLELDNLYGDRPEYEPEPTDDEKPKVLRCRVCGEVMHSWDEYTAHEHFQTSEKYPPEEDGHFPEMDMDKALAPHFHEREPFIFPLAHTQWKLAAGDPKDQINDPIPFVYDVDGDQIVVGQPGQHTHDVQGDFNPAAIVEGFYEPGGKVVITTRSRYPYSTRHMLDLWYWSLPHMEITGLEYQNQDGSRQKLATTRTAQDIGQYVRSVAMADPAAWQAHKALSEAGGEVFVVGGAVRDALMQKEPKDIDLMVTGLHQDNVSYILNQLPGKVDLTGKDFGVFRYRNRGAEVEIALPRSERSTGDRRVDFDVSVDHSLPVERDLERRDFSANSMAVSLADGRLVDPFGGAQDIASGTLRTTHPNSFREDPTRLVRGLVAHSKHGLLPDEETRQQMMEHADRLLKESPDRIGTELTKLFQSPNPASAIRLAKETGLLEHLLPEVSSNWDFDQKNPHHAQKLGDHLVSVLEGTQAQSQDPDLRLAALLHDIGKPASQWIDEHGIGHYYEASDGRGQNHEAVGAVMAEERLRALRFSKARTSRITDLIRHHMFPAFSSPKGARKFLNNVGDHADDLMLLRHADMFGKGTDEYQNTKTPVDTMRQHVETARSSAGPTKASDLAIGGNELMTALGIPPGPQIGQIKQRLMEAVLDNPELNTPEGLLGLARGMV